jgi:3-(3-hydroxy-phenyl)propionate hydroxylase
MTGTRLQADIVVVGLGPVGAVAANLAGAAGLRTVVLDRELQPYIKPRAIVFDAEIMRDFASIGLAEAITGVTRPLGGSVYLGSDLKPIRTFRSPGPDHDQAAHPSNLFYQPQLESILREGLRRFPSVEVRLGQEVRSVRQAEGMCVVAASGRGGGLEIEAPVVLACDGASSTVRKALGIGLDDIGFEERWLVVDTFVHGPMVWPDTHEIPEEVRDGRYSLMVCDPARPSTLIPGVGEHRRWEYMLRPHETDEEVTTEPWLRREIANWVDPRDVEIVRSAVYRFRALVAERWRDGGVFLLGDAAHQTPPFFGQGMCHGVRDAAQLMWKLGLVRDGAASDALLDTYQLEREPHVRAIINASVEAGAAVCKTDPDEARTRDLEFRAAEAARAGKAVAMTDVVPPLRHGVIEPRTGGARFPQFVLRAGDGQLRALDDLLGGRFAIVRQGPSDALSPDLAAAWARLGGRRIMVSGDVDGRLGAWLDSAGATAVVIRPDRYVYGLARSDGELDELLRGLIDQLGAPSSKDRPVPTSLERSRP